MSNHISESVSLENRKYLQKLRYSNLYDYILRNVNHLIAPLLQAANPSHEVLPGDVWSVEQKKAIHERLVRASFVSPDPTLERIVNVLEQEIPEEDNPAAAYYNLLSRLDSYYDSSLKALMNKFGVSALAEQDEDGLLSGLVMQCNWLEVALGIDGFFEVQDSSKSISKELDEYIERLMKKGVRDKKSWAFVLMVRKYQSRPFPNEQELSLESLSEDHELYQVLRRFEGALADGGQCLVGGAEYTSLRASKKITKKVASGEVVLVAVCTPSEEDAILLARVEAAKALGAEFLNDATVFPVITPYPTGASFLVVPKGEIAKPVYLFIHPSSLDRLVSVAGPLGHLGVYSKQVKLVQYIRRRDGAEADMKLFREFYLNFIENSEILGQWVKDGDPKNVQLRLNLHQRPFDYQKARCCRETNRISRNVRGPRYPYIGQTYLSFYRYSWSDALYCSTTLGIGSGPKLYGRTAGEALYLFWKYFGEFDPDVMTIFGSIVGGFGDHLGYISPSGSIISRPPSGWYIDSFPNFLKRLSQDKISSLSTVIDERTLNELHTLISELKGRLSQNGLKFTDSHVSVYSPFEETSIYIDELYEFAESQGIRLGSIDCEHSSLVQAAEMIERDFARSIQIFPIDVCSDNVTLGQKDPRYTLGFNQLYFESQDASPWFEMIMDTEECFAKYRALVGNRILP